MQNFGIKQLIRSARVWQHIRRKVFLAYYHDAKRYICHATELNANVYAKSRLEGRITMQYHVVEKGLTMPEMRLGFGRLAIYELINSCEVYERKFGKENCQVNHAINVLDEYVKTHQKNAFQIDQEIVDKVAKLVQSLPKFSCVSNQIETTNEDYFSFNNSSFEDFARSRHSLRNFSDTDIPLELITKSVDLAQTAPTSCNRQPARVRIVSDRHLIDAILELHTGNRGFGYLSNKIIVLSGEIGVYNEPRERNLVYVDTEIYAMNLLYALHYHKIGACALNWATAESSDNQLRKILNIPDSEVISLLIACGNAPAEFRIANSLRYPADDIVKFY